MILFFHNFRSIIRCFIEIYQGRWHIEGVISLSFLATYQGIVLIYDVFVKIGLGFAVLEILFAKGEVLRGWLTTAAISGQTLISNAVDL